MEAVIENEFELDSLILDQYDMINTYRDLIYENINDNNRYTTKTFTNEYKFLEEVIVDKILDLKNFNKICLNDDEKAEDSVFVNAFDFVKLLNDFLIYLWDENIYLTDNGTLMFEIGLDGNIVNLEIGDNYSSMFIKRSNGAIILKDKIYFNKTKSINEIKDTFKKVLAI